VRQVRNLRHHTLAFQEEIQIPLTKSELDIMSKKLLFDNKPNNNEEIIINILDPFCADGSALQEVAQALKAQGANVKTYGVEPDQENRRIAKKRLTKTVHGNYHELRTTNAFSLILANPPIGGKNAIGIPQEAIAFSDLTAPGKYVYPGSIVIFALPISSLNFLRSILPIRLQDICYYKISQERVLIMATKSKGRVPKEEAAQERERLDFYIENSTEIPLLNTETKYHITPTTTGITRFVGSRLDPEDISEEIAISSVWNNLKNLITPKSVLIEAPKPLMALDKGRPAIAAAAGVLDKATTSHIRRGFNKIIIEKQHVENDDSIVQVEINRPVSRLRIFHPGGVKDLEY